MSKTRIRAKNRPITKNGLDRILFKRIFLFMVCPPYSSTILGSTIEFITSTTRLINANMAADINNMD